MNFLHFRMTFVCFFFWGLIFLHRKFVFFTKKSYICILSATDIHYGIENKPVRQT